MRGLIATIAVFLCSGLVWADDSAKREFTSEFAIPEGSDLEVGLKVGELEVETADIDKVIVEVEARCRPAADAKCFRRLEKIQAESVVNDAGSSVRIAGVSKTYSKMEVEATITVPATSALAVKMYAGELSVNGGGQDLDVRLKYGDVTVRQPMAATQSVMADANFGDAKIYAPAGDPNSKRPWLVGAKVTWDEGAGDSTVTVNLSAGDATVHLD